MKEIKLMMFDTCPHCHRAEAFIKELQKEERYKDLVITRINEQLEPERAAQYDYYYVPTFFVDEKKLHEGVIQLEDVRRVFEAALED